MEKGKAHTILTRDELKNVHSIFKTLQKHTINSLSNVEVAAAGALMLVTATHAQGVGFNGALSMLLEMQKGVYGDLEVENTFRSFVGLKPELSSEDMKKDLEGGRSSYWEKYDDHLKKWSEMSAKMIEAVKGESFTDIQFAASRIMTRVAKSCSRPFRQPLTVLMKVAETEYKAWDILDTLKETLEYFKNLGFTGSFESSEGSEEKVEDIHVPFDRLGRLHLWGLRHKPR